MRTCIGSPHPNSQGTESVSKSREGARHTEYLWDVIKMKKERSLLEMERIYYKLPNQEAKV